MNNHEFDDIIKQKAQEREADVPTDIWDGIVAEKKKRRIPFFWLTFLILVLTGLAVVWNLNSEKKPGVTAVIEKVSNDTSQLIHQRESTEKLSSNTNTEAAPSENKTQKIENIPGTKEVRSNNTDRVDQKVKPTTELKNGSGSSDNNIIDAGLQKAVLSAKKEKSITTIDDDNSIFASRKNKRNMKGNSTMRIRAGALDSLVETAHINTMVTLANEEKSVDTNNDQHGKQEEVQLKVAEQDLAESTTGNIENTMIGNLKVDSTENKNTVTRQEDSAVKKHEVQILTDTKSNKEKSSEWTIEAGLIAVSPMQQYDQPTHVTRIISSKNFHSEFISDHTRSSVEAGSGLSVNLIKQLNKKWSAGTGIQLLRFTEKIQLSGIETSTNYTIVQRVVDNPNGPSLKADTVSAISKASTILSGRNIYNNLSIPVFVRYKFLQKKKFAASFSAGVNVDIVRSYKNNMPGDFETTYNYGSNAKKSGTTAGFGFLAGLHFSGALYKKYEWFAAPSFTYSLTSYKTNNLSFNKKIQMAGLVVGVGYRLSK